MNGMKQPKFMENSTINQSYYEQPNPYVNVPSCHVNLLELSRYAQIGEETLVCADWFTVIISLEAEYCGEEILHLDNWPVY